MKPIIDVIQAINIEGIIKYRYLICYYYFKFKNFL